MPEVSDADRAKAADDADRATVDRLMHGAWFTANRPNLSWETHAREIAAALADARAEADQLRDAMRALAEEWEANGGWDLDYAARVRDLADGGRR